MNFNARGKIMELSLNGTIGVRRCKMHKFIVDNDKVLTDTIYDKFLDEYTHEEIMATLKWLRQRKFIVNKRVWQQFEYSYCKEWER